MNENIKILFVEDLPSDVELALRVIKKEHIDFEYKVVDTENDFTKELSAFKPDIIISDYSMPTFDGMMALNITRATHQYLPFIILTGSMNEETAVKCMKAGANDYVIKEKITRLPFAILEALESNKARIEKMTMEEKLIESEEKFRAIFDQHSAIKLLIDPENGNILEANNAAAKFYGWSKEELTSKNISQINILSQEEIYQEIEKVKKENKNYFEFKHRKANGDIVDIEAFSKLIITGGKKIIHSIVHDVSDKKIAQKALQQASRNWDITFQAMRNGIALLDSEQRIIQSNIAFREIVNKSSSEINGLRCYEIMHGIDHPFEECPFTKMLKTKKRENTELIFKGKFYELVVDPIFDDDNNIAGAVHIINDISQRKYDEQVQHILYEIASSSMKSESLKEITTITKNELSKVIDATNFFVALYHPNTNSLRAVFSMDEKDNNTEWDINNSLSGQVIKQKRTILLTKDEEEVFKEKLNIELKGTQAECWLGVPIIIDGKALGVIVLQSYTNKNAYDSKSIKLLELIAYELAVVIQRNKMIDELVFAKEKAEENDKLKTAFLMNMSHEIRTPMNGILGFISLLNNPDIKESEKNKYTEIINISGNRLLNTINDIIEISKIESEAIEIFEDKINVNKLLEDHYIELKHQAEAKGLNTNIINEIVQSELIIVSDKYKLDTILKNLIRNAIKYTEKGNIELGCKYSDKYLEFYVRDTGIGISKDRQKAIFDKFIQADIGDKGVFEGLGLGLSIAKYYAEILGGRIWVESEEGLGSTFYFTIATKLNDSLSIIKSEENQRSPEASKPKKDLKILIAEDDETSYYYLTILLRSLGCKILRAKNGKEAIDVCKYVSDIDVILMDIKMPVLDGYEATRQIRQFNKSIPIIAQTAFAQDEDKEKAIESGCNAFITKPMKKDTLISTINKFT